MIGEIIIATLAISTICFLAAIYEKDSEERKRQKDLRNRWRED